MTDLNFHQRMMGIPVDETSPAFPEPPHLQLVYRYGHRDARHAAAEIANEADEAINELRLHIDDLTNGGALAAANAEIESLMADCKRLRSDLTRHEQCADEIIRRIQRERRAALEEVDALTKSCDYVTSELRSAVDRLGLRTALADALRGADPDNATAEQLARFFWIWSHGERSCGRLEGATRNSGERVDWSRREPQEEAPEEAAALREEIAVLNRDRRLMLGDIMALRERIADRETATPETTSDGRERFAAAVAEARAWMQSHRGGEWVGWSCAVLLGSQEVTSPGWYALPPGQWVSEPAILIEHATRDGMELPTVAQAVETLGVPVKAEE